MSEVSLNIISATTRSMPVSVKLDILSFLDEEDKYILSWAIKNSTLEEDIYSGTIEYYLKNYRQLPIEKQNQVGLAAKYGNIKLWEYLNASWYKTQHYSLSCFVPYKYNH